MTISITSTRAEYTGDGVTLNFDIKDGSDGIYFEANSEISVYTTDTTDGTVTELTQGVDYEIDEESAGTDEGSITLLIDAPDSDTKISIIRSTPLVQDLDLTKGGVLNQATLESLLDEVYRIDQEHNTRIDRTLRKKEGNDGGDLTLPIPSARADKFITFDASGNVSLKTASEIVSSAVSTALAAISKQSVTADSATLDIDMSDGWHIELSLEANVTTFTVSNWPSGFARMTIDIANTGAFNISDWPGTTLWPNGNAPTITSGDGSKDTIILTSTDGGSNFRGYIPGQDFS